MKILDTLNILRALGAGGLVGALGRVVAAATAAESSMGRPELTELRAALDELRRALRIR